MNLNTRDFLELKTVPHNLVPRVVSEPLSQKTTLVQGSLLIKILFYRHDASNGCQDIVSIYRYKHFVDMKILYLQQDAGQDPK